MRGRKIAKLSSVVICLSLFHIIGCDPAPLAASGHAAQSAGATVPANATSRDAGPPLPVKMGFAYGYMDATGKIILAPLYAYAGPFHNGLAYVEFPSIRGPLADLFEDPAIGPSRRAFIDATGQIRLALPDASGPFRESSFGPFLDGYALVNQPYRAGERKVTFIDTTGKIVLDPDFAETRDFAEGLAAVNRPAAHIDQFGNPTQVDQWGYIDRTGKLAVPPRFSEARDFVEGLAAVRDPQTALWGYIDRTGTFVIAPTYTGAWNFSAGFAVVESAGKKQLIDKTGAPQGATAPALGRFSEGLVAFNEGGTHSPFEPNLAPDSITGGKWGYLDKTGKVVIPAQYAFAQPFSEGLAAINVGGKSQESVSEGGLVEGGKWGYVDATGRVVIAPTFSDAGPFDHAVADVAGHLGLGSTSAAYIDPTGHAIRPTSVADEALPQTPEASTGGRVTNLIRAFDLANVADEQLIAFDIARRSIDRKRRRPPSFTLANHAQLTPAMGVFSQNAPRISASRAASRRPAAPEVRAEAQRLRKALARCGATDDEAACELNVRIDDYDNVSRDPNMTAISQERLRLAFRPDAAMRARLERRLTGIMTKLREATLHSAAGRAAAASGTLQPVTIRISDSDDVNVVANYQSSTLTVSRGLLLDVYLRAFHRAAIGFRLRSGEAALLEDCTVCGFAEREIGLFTLSAERMAYLNDRLPSLRIDYLSSRALATAIERRCGASRPEERHDLLAVLRSGSDSDVRDKFGGTVSFAQRYLACGSGASAARITEYLHERDELDTPTLTADPIQSDYLPFASEKLELGFQVSAEMMKALTFILAHESYHLWLSPLTGPEAEYGADAHGIDLYYRIYGRTDVGAAIDPSALAQFGTNQQALVTRFFEIMGRDPVTLLREVFSGTRYYSGTESHPPVADRVARISAMMARKKLTFTCPTTSVQASITIEDSGDGLPRDRRACTLVQEHQHHAAR